MKNLKAFKSIENAQNYLIFISLLIAAFPVLSIFLQFEWAKDFDKIITFFGICATILGLFSKRQLLELQRQSTAQNFADGYFHNFLDHVILHLTSDSSLAKPESPSQMFLYIPSTKELLSENRFQTLKNILSSVPYSYDKDIIYVNNQKTNPRSVDIVFNTNKSRRIYIDFARNLIPMMSIISKDSAATNTAEEVLYKKYIDSYKKAIENKMNKEVFNKYIIFIDSIDNI